MASNHFFAAAKTCAFHMRTLPQSIALLACLLIIFILQVQIIAADEQTWSREDANNGNTRFGARGDFLARQLIDDATPRLFLHSPNVTQRIASAQQDVHELGLLQYTRENAVVGNFRALQASSLDDMIYFIVTEGSSKVVYGIDARNGAAKFATPVAVPKPAQQRHNAADMSASLTLLSVPATTLLRLTTSDQQFSKKEKERYLTLSRSGATVPLLAVSTNFQLVLLLDALSGKIVTFFDDENDRIIRSQAGQGSRSAPVALQDSQLSGTGSSGLIYLARTGELRVMNSNLTVAARYILTDASYAFEDAMALVPDAAQPLLLTIARNSDQITVEAVNAGDKLIAYRFNVAKSVISEAWSYSSSGASLGAPVLLSTRAAAVVQNNSSIVSLDLSTGHVLWTWNSSISSSQLLQQMAVGSQGQLLYAVDAASQQVIALNATSGALLWQRQPFPQAKNVALYSAITMAGESVVILGLQSQQKTIFARAFASDGSTLWQQASQLKIDSLQSISSLGSPIISTNGMISFAALVKVLRNGTVVPSVALAQLMPTTIEAPAPDYFFTDDQDLMVQIASPTGGLKHSQVSSMSCLLHYFNESSAAAAPNLIRVPAMALNDRTAQCSFESLPDQLRTVNTRLGLQFAVRLKQSSMESRSNMVQMRFCKPPEVYDHSPLGVPLNAFGANITVAGSGFINLMPSSLTRKLSTACRFVLEDAQKPIYVTATVLDDQNIVCPLPQELTSEEIEMAVEISTDYDPATPQLSRFSRSRYILVVYEPPTVEGSLVPYLGPLKGDTQINIIFDFSGAVSIRALVLDAPMHCGFQLPSQQRMVTSEASCAQITASSQTTSQKRSASPLVIVDESHAKTVSSRIWCQCHVPSTQVVETAQFWFSANGEHFNATSVTYSYYKDPVLLELSPRSGNISGHTLVTIQAGRGSFQPTPLLSCRFGKYLVSIAATYVNDSTIQCLSPKVENADPTSMAPPLRALTVNVGVSLNRVDWSYGSENFTFTYENYRACPDSCNGRGTCDIKTGICVCHGPYKGVACERFIREGYWTVVALVFLAVSILFFLSLLFMFIFFQYRSHRNYQKLMNERQRIIIL